MRKGKKRRENFAMAVQNTARSKRQKTHDLNSSISSHTSSTGASESLTGRENSSNRMMQPPSTPFHKRQSLPPNLNHTAENENTVGTKRKREDPVADGQRNTPKYTNISHQRSRTIGTSIMSGPPHRPSRSPYKSRMDLSTVKDGSLLSDILVKQARRLAPNAKSDTTRTDYFQLKALGVDPDTPVVPLGKKRTGDGLKTDGTQNSVKTSPPRSAFTQTAEAASQSAAQTPSGVDDEDEALFAQIRSVREALAESEQWCKNERQTIERSMTPQASSSPPEAGTPGQRRLREIRERGSTPSRTELRLRAMGDRALLPKGFWDGEGMGRSLMRKGKEKEEGTPATDSMNRSWDPIGAGPAMSAAPIRLGQMDGLMNGQIGGGSDQRRQANKAQKGSSEEDAIEL